MHWLVNPSRRRRTNPPQGPTSSGRDSNFGRALSAPAHRPRGVLLMEAAVEGDIVVAALLYIDAATEDARVKQQRWRAGLQHASADRDGHCHEIAARVDVVQLFPVWAPSRVMPPPVDICYARPSRRLVGRGGRWERRRVGRRFLRVPSRLSGTRTIDHPERRSPGSLGSVSARGGMASLRRSLASARGRRWSPASSPSRGKHRPSGDQLNGNLADFDVSNGCSAPVPAELFIHKSRTPEPEEP